MSKQQPYQFKQYPSMVYTEDGKGVMVQNAKEHRIASEEYGDVYDSPNPEKRKLFRSKSDPRVMEENAAKEDKSIRNRLKEAVGGGKSRKESTPAPEPEPEDYETAARKSKSKR